MRNIKQQQVPAEPGDAGSSGDSWKGSLQGNNVVSSAFKSSVRSQGPATYTSILGPEDRDTHPTDVLIRCSFAMSVPTEAKKAPFLSYEDAMSRTFADLGDLLSFSCLPFRGYFAYVSRENFIHPHRSQQNVLPQFRRSVPVGTQLTDSEAPTRVGLL